MINALNELKIAIYGLEKRILEKLDHQEQAFTWDRDYTLGELTHEIKTFIVETMKYLRYYPNQKIKEDWK